MDGALHKRPPPLVASPVGAVPPSDPGDLEETRAALLGERYWAAPSPLRETHTGAAMQLDSDSESAPSPSRPQASSSTAHGAHHPSPSFAAPRRRPTPSSPLADTSDPDSSQLSLPALRKPAALPPVRLVSPLSSSPSQPAPGRAHQPAASTSRASSPSRSRSPTPRARAPPSSSLAGAAFRPTSSRATSPPPIIPPDPDPPIPAGRSFRQRTAAQLAPYSTEHQRYAVSLLRNGWEGAVVRGLPRGHEEDGEDEVRRRKEAAEKAERVRRARLGGWLVDEEEEGEGGDEGSTPRVGGSGAPRTTATTGGRYERDGAWVSTAPSGETEDEDEGLELDGDDLLEREARRRDRMRRAVDAAMGDDGASRAHKRKHSPHRHGPSRLDDPHYLSNAGATSRRRRHNSTGASSKRPRPSRPFADDHDRDAADSGSSSGSGSSAASGSESDSLPPPHELGTTRTARRKPKRKRTSAPESRRRAPDAGADAARRPRPVNGRAESAPPSSSPARTSRKRSGGNGRGQGHGTTRRDGSGAGKSRRGPAGSEPARDGLAVRRRPDRMALPAGSLHGRSGRGGGERGEEDWEGELRALDSGSDGASGSGGERDVRRRRYGGDSDDSPSASRSSSAPALDRTGDADEPSSDVSASARPAPRLEVRGKRRRALGAMMPAVFLKKAVADLELMKRERRARRAGGVLGSSDAELDGGDESDELNSGDEEALERERERKRRARARVKVRRRDDDGADDGRPSLLGADVFTDESGSAPERSDDDDAHDDEADAVASWLDSFAPRSRKGRGGGAAAGGAADEDIVDRFLRRARRPPRRPVQRQPSRKKGGAAGAGRAGHGEGKDAPARASAAGVGAGRADKQQQRGVLRDSGNYVAGYRPLKGPAAPAWQRRPRQVALDTDEAVFAFVGLRDGTPRDEATDADIVIVGSPRRPAAPRPAGAVPADFGIPAVPRALGADEPDGEVWASFGRFSHDFDLHRLAPGVRFAGPDSFVRNGYLFSLVEPSALPQGPFAADVFGCRLLSSMAADELDPLVPTVCDGAYDALAASLGAADDAASPLVEITSALRFLGHWTSTQAGRIGADALGRLGTAVIAHLERLDTRLDTLAVPDDAAVRAFRLRRTVLSWHTVDLAARLRKECGDSIVDSARLQRLVAVLVRRLLQHGVDRTTRTLKAARTPDALVTDVTVEAWLGLVSLALSDGGNAGLSESDLWTTVVAETRSTLAGTRAERGPGGGEVLSYTAMALCAVSQFSPSGISTSKPRLAAHWPVLLATLEAIQPVALAQPDHALSSTAVARRDRYLWTLFARCLVFVERWAWSVDIRDDLLPRLFDLLNARRLADLTTETAGDFPPFLQDLALFDKKVDLDSKRDTAFVIFLKLVMAAAAVLPSSSDAEKRRRGAQLTRLFLRLSPMVSSAWSKQSVELTSRGPSVLVNHYSLHLAFAALLPSAAPQRIEQAARLIAFANVDDEARKTCIRAVLYFALVARRHQVALGPVVEWLAAITSTLKTEYGAVERERRKDERLQRRGGGAGGAGGPSVGGPRARDGSKGDPLWTRALMITMVLRSVQVATRWRRSGEDQAAVDYPNSALLHPAWTSQLLDSPLALDPMIGREAIRTIECFLDVRRAALPRPTVPQGAAAGHGDSQDDFGMLDDMDFDDPALNAMLGIDGGAGVADGQQKREDEIKAQDKAFAELLRTRIAPAFFRLVSNIFVDQQASGPTVVDRVSYAQTAVECWTRCLAVAVENRVADWRPYLQYGDQSWKRLSDPVGRRDIGLFLVIQILKHDPAVYTAFADDVVEILFESIVARRLTSQHVLLEQLLNADQHEHLGTVSPLLDGLPFVRTTETGRVQVEQLDLLDKRLDVLTILFRNAARLVVASTAGHSGSTPLSTTQLLHRPAARPSIPRGTVMNLLRSMLAAMKDNLTAIHDESTRASYASFVRLVLGALTSAGNEAAVGQGGAGPRAGVKKGPFDEMALPDIRALRSAVA
ncbi:hypothetical protein JCM8208_007311 [Rhodotorula glutinis]